jgi:putative hydrolase of the HAD superfamily
VVPVAAVGFDLDGTLFDHEGAARAAITAFVTERGWPLADDTPDRWVALERVHFGEYARGLIGFQEQRRRRMGALVQALRVDADPDGIDDLFDSYFAHYRANWTAYPDTIPALDLLAARGVALGVLTNGTQELQTSKLERLGILDRFDVVLAASELPEFKPHATAFDALCGALGVPASDVVFVGDDLEADVAGAAAAGLRPVWIDRDATGGAPDGVTVVASLVELERHAPAGSS